MGRITLSRVHAPTPASLFLLVATAGLLAVGGCSAGFERNWKAAGNRPAETNDFRGRWQGRWKSQATGHTGGLRAVVTRQGETTKYRSQFHATYGGIFQFGYTAVFDVESGGDAAYFSGKSDLGWLAGGVYHYDGYATPVKFYCTYRSKDDHGYFEMHRPDVGAATRGRIAGVPAGR